MNNYTKFRRRLLKNKETREAYETLGPEYAFISIIIRRRIERGFTQQDLARKVGTKQAAISRLESGKSNPSVSFLRHIADALGKELDISLK